MAGSHQAMSPWQSGVAAKLHQTIPNNRLAIIPNTAHYPHVENPDECAAQILAFLSELAH